MAEAMKLHGLKELDRALADLQKLGGNAGFKALRSGMMQASKPLFLAARAGAAATGIKDFDAGATAAAMGRWTKKNPIQSHHVVRWPKKQEQEGVGALQQQTWHASNAHESFSFGRIWFCAWRRPTVHAPRLRGDVANSRA